MNGICSDESSRIVGGVLPATLNLHSHAGAVPDGATPACFWGDSVLQPETGGKNDDPVAMSPAADRRAPGPRRRGVGKNPTLRLEMIGKARNIFSTPLFPPSHAPESLGNVAVWRPIIFFLRGCQLSFSTKTASTNGAALLADQAPIFPGIFFSFRRRSNGPGRRGRRWWAARQGPGFPAPARRRQPARRRRLEAGTLPFLISPTTTRMELKWTIHRQRS